MNVVVEPDRGGCAGAKARIVVKKDCDVICTFN